MILDGEYVGVIDRFEEDFAVVLLEDDGETVAEFAIPETEISQEGRHQDAVLTVRVEDGGIVDATYDESETNRRNRDAQDRFDRLSQRPPRDDES